jgi:hypothetical protein
MSIYLVNYKLDSAHLSSLLHVVKCGGFSVSLGNAKIIIVIFINIFHVHLLQRFNFPWPNMLSCDKLPEKSDPRSNLCMEAPSVTDEPEFDEGTLGGALEDNLEWKKIFAEFNIRYVTLICFFFVRLFCYLLQLLLYTIGWGCIVVLVNVCFFVCFVAVC